MIELWRHGPKLSLSGCINMSDVTSTDRTLQTADAPGNERLPVSIHELSVYYLTRETVNAMIAT
jgi:hypothetical protein